MNKRTRLTIIISTIVVLTLISILILLKKTNIYIYFDNIDSKQTELIEKGLTEEFQDMNFIISENIKSSNLIFTTDKRNLDTDNLTTLDIGKKLPSSLRESGVVGQEQLFVPVELTHTELLLTNKLFKRLYSDEILTQKELIEELKNLNQKDRPSLVVAAKDKQTFINFLSLMILTTYTSDDLNNFYTDLDQNNDLSIRVINILDKLINWRSVGILHNEWLEFDEKTVLTFLENNLSKAGIISLNEHRNFPTETINQFTAIPFPDNKDNRFAKDLMVKPLYFAINRSKKTDKYINTFIDYLIGESFQKSLTFSTGLAPSNPTVTTLDKQASDLRYWAAASAKLIDTYHIKDKSNIDLYLTKVREYLISNQ